MAITFRQWDDDFDSTTEEVGCSLAITNARTYDSVITATIASASDTADQATANITSAVKLPTLEEGRVRFWFRTPPTFDLLGNSVIFQARNAAGPLTEIFIDSAQLIKLYTAPNTLHSSGGVWDPGSPTTFQPNSEYIIEYAWRKNGFINLWVNGRFIAEYTMSGSTGDAITTSARVGIDHYDGADASGWTAKYRLFQMGTDAGAALIDPQLATFLPVRRRG